MSNTKAIQFSSSVQELMPQTKACNADMKHSDWLKIVVWLATSNHSALFQYSKCSAIYNFDLIFVAQTVYKFTIWKRNLNATHSRYKRHLKGITGSRYIFGHITLWSLHFALTWREGVVDPADEEEPGLKPELGLVPVQVELLQVHALGQIDLEQEQEQIAAFTETKVFYWLIRMRWLTKMIKVGVSTVAQWNHLCPPFCRPGFESWAHHLSLFRL